MKRWKLSVEDCEDLTQILWLTALEKQAAYDPAHSSGAPLDGFLAHVMDNTIFNWLETRETEKRGGGVRIVSLDEEFQSEAGDPVTLKDTIKGEVAQPLTEFMMDLGRALPHLSPQQLEIGRLMMNGFSASEIAVYLKIPRTTLQDELNRIAVVLFQNGLKDYLPESWNLPAWVLRSVKRAGFPVPDR